MSSNSNTPPEDYFNDLSNPGPNKRRRSPVIHDKMGTDRPSGEHDNGVPRLKRIACVICRKRKLKCDGSKPSCSTCTRLNHNCAYDEVRRKSGPKRGYVKALEARLKQVETLLKTPDPSEKVPEAVRANFGISGNNPNLMQAANAEFNVTNPSIAIGNNQDPEGWGFPGESPQPQAIDDMTFNASLNMGITIDEANFTWEMIGLGLEEPLPPQETIDELHQIYFDKIHLSMPMIHKYRYLAAMNLAPNQRPPVALRYAIWMLAASITEKYADLKDIFYQRARKYLELDYMKGHGEHIMSVGHCQTHIILASYEFKMMYFPRAWMNTGSGIRLSQMLGLHRLDGAGLDVKQCLSPPRDWTEREERRRTFWMSFCEDRYASIGTGWPMTIDEKDILTSLPASEEAFEKSKPEPTQTLQESLSPSGASKLSAFGSVVLMACLFGRNLVHLHRPDPDDKDHDLLNGEFWKRHRNLDNILLNTSLSLPSHLKLPNGVSNPNIVYTNMNIHASTICLHQAAIYKADKNRLPASVSKESKLRCINAANEIASIMRMVSHMDLSSMNPFMSFCLYVAARVFVQYLKSRPDDNSTGDSLRFLLCAMNALKSKNPLTESFIAQLDIELESLGMGNPKYKLLFQDLLLARTVSPCMFTKNCDGIGPNGPVDQLLKVDEDSPVDSSTVENRPGEPLNWLNDNGLSSEVHPVALHGILVGTSGFDQAGGMPGHINPYMQSDANISETDHSDRPTPNSSTASSLQPGTGQTGHHSGRSSFEASPASTHLPRPQEARIASPFFRHPPDFTGVGGVSTGVASGATYNLSPTAGTHTDMTRDFAVHNGWEMSGQGLTPVAEGVLRELMDLRPNLGQIDMTWTGTP